MACSCFRSIGAGAAPVLPPNTSAARSCNCRFHSVTWLGWTSNRCAISANVLSQANAASATFDLNTAECVRLALLLVIFRSVVSPRRAVKSSRISTFQLVQISGTSSGEAAAMTPAGFGERGRLDSVRFGAFIKAAGIKGD